MTLPSFHIPWDLTLTSLMTLAGLVAAVVNLRDRPSKRQYGDDLVLIIHDFNSSLTSLYDTVIYVLEHNPVLLAIQEGST